MLCPYCEFLAHITAFSEVDPGEVVDVAFEWESSLWENFRGAFGDTVGVAVYGV